MGCEFAQGYFFARPLDLAAARSLLADDLPFDGPPAPNSAATTSPAGAAAQACLPVHSPSAKVA